MGPLPPLSARLSVMLLMREVGVIFQLKVVELIAPPAGMVASGGRAPIPTTLIRDGAGPRGEWSGSQPDPDILDLQVVPHARQPALAADAAVLGAAGGRLLAADEPAVDPHRPGLEPAGEGQRPGDVAGVDTGAEAVAEAVGELQRLLLVAERGHGEDGPEHLLAGDAGRRVDAVEDRGGDEVAALEAGRAAAAGDEAGAVAAGPRGGRGGAPLVLGPGPKAPVGVLAGRGGGGAPRAGGGRPPP